MSPAKGCWPRSFAVSPICPFQQWRLRHCTVQMLWKPDQRRFWNTIAHPDDRHGDSHNPCARQGDHQGAAERQLALIKTVEDFTSAKKEVFLSENIDASTKRAKGWGSDRRSVQSHRFLMPNLHRSLLLAGVSTVALNCAAVAQDTDTATTPSGAEDSAFVLGDITLTADDVAGYVATGAQTTKSSTPRLTTTRVPHWKKRRVCAKRIICAPRHR